MTTSAAVYEKRKIAATIVTAGMHRSPAFNEVHALSASPRPSQPTLKSPCSPCASLTFHFEVCSHCLTLTLAKHARLRIKLSEYLPNRMPWFYSTVPPLQIWKENDICVKNSNWCKRDLVDPCSYFLTCNVSSQPPDKNTLSSFGKYMTENILIIWPSITRNDVLKILNHNKLLLNPAIPIIIISITISNLNIIPSINFNLFHNHHYDHHHHIILNVTKISNGLQFYH